MSLVVSVIMAIVTTAIIGYPFYQQKQKKIKFDVNNKVEDLNARKMEIYTAIKDIEFDHEMGKLSEEDFQNLRDEYKTEAAQILKKIDQLSGKKRKPVKMTMSAKSKFCHICGQKVVADDKFCASCGTSLQPKT